MGGKRGWAVTEYVLWLKLCCAEESTTADFLAQTLAKGYLQIPVEDQVNDVVQYANHRIKSVILRSYHSVSVPRTGINSLRVS